MTVEAPVNLDRSSSRFKTCSFFPKIGDKDGVMLLVSDHTQICMLACSPVQECGRVWNSKSGIGSSCVGWNLLRQFGSRNDSAEAVSFVEIGPIAFALLAR